MIAPTVVIWNPNAGSTAISREVRSRLESQPNVTFFETGSENDATELAANAADSGAQLVVAAGGDGTINAVVNGLADHAEGTRLAILPLGTGNDLCRTLGVPTDPLQAIALLESPTVRRLDLVKARSGGESHYFINMANGGNSQHVTEQLTPELKQRWGPFCYVRGVAEVITELDRFHTTVRFDGGEAEQFDVFNIFVGNARTCGGGLAVAPLANPEDGLLDVMIVLDGGPLDMAALAARFLLSDFLDSEMVIRRRAKQLQISSQPPMLFLTDGDPTTTTPADFTIVPGALEVVVGPEYEADVTLPAGEDDDADMLPAF